MTQITLTSDQTAQLTAATDEVVIADSNGREVVRLAGPVSDEEADILAESKRRLANLEGARPFSEVIAELKAQYPADGPVAE